MRLRFPWATVTATRPVGVARWRVVVAMVVHEVLESVPGVDAHGNRWAARYAIGVSATKSLPGQRGSALLTVTGEDQPAVVDGAFLFEFDGSRVGTGQVSGSLVAICRGNASTNQWESFPFDAQGAASYDDTEDLFIDGQPGHTLQEFADATVANIRSLAPDTPYQLTGIVAMVHDVDFDAGVGSNAQLAAIGDQLTPLLAFDVILDAFVVPASASADFDGTTPKLDIGTNEQFATGSGAGLFAQYAGGAVSVATGTTAIGKSLQSGLRGGSPSVSGVVVPADGPLYGVVSQDGTKGGTPTGSTRGQVSLMLIIARPAPL